MASGHVNRANRPNTWLLRPMLQREDSSCQPGAVHTWPLADMTAGVADVRFRGVEQTWPDRPGTSENDPKGKSGAVASGCATDLVSCAARAGPYSHSDMR